MPLESATVISELDPSWPLAGDPTNQGDDHLRLTKSVLQSQFPGAGGTGFAVPITATEDDLNNTSGSTSNFQTQIDALQAEVDALQATLLPTIFPIGCIYSTITNENPATTFGFGTWEAFGAGRTMVGVDPGDPLFDTAEETGGSKNAVVVEHNHTASTATDGEHEHRIQVDQYCCESSPDPGTETMVTDDTDRNRIRVMAPENKAMTTDSAHSHAITVADAGVNGDNQNLPPYIAVYFWKRTA